MTLLEYVRRTLLLAADYTILNLLYVGFTATVGSLLLRFPIREVSLFFGPRLGGFLIGDLKCSVRAIPLGSFVRFGTDEDDDLPTEEQTLARVHPLLHVPAQLAGSAGLLLVGMVLLGVTPALQSLASGLRFFVSLLYTPQWFGRFPAILHERFAVLPSSTFLGLAAVYMAAANLIPVPLNPGGAVVIDLVKTVVRVPLRTHERLLQIGFIVLVLVTAALLIQYIRYGLAMTSGAA